MNQSREFWIRQIRDLVFLILAGCIMTFFLSAGAWKSLPGYVLVSSFTASIWIFLWKGNDFLTHVVDRYVSWIEEPIKRFVVGMIATIVYSSGIVLLLTYIFERFVGLNFGDITAMVLVSLLITLVISLFLHGREFYLNWKRAELNSERLEKENIKAQYDNLKSQVNPHFLFNSLNALTNLVYEDQDKAAKFIKQLSEVYRYVLDTRDREIVSIREELNFLESYLFLQKIRFENNLVTKIELNGLEADVAPLSIQMLFENAIKHNVISKESPLEINIYSDSEYIIVENTLQPKIVSREEIKGMGLENIVNRYSFLSERKVRIEKTDKSFRVCIPVIRTDQSR